jgi:hypothetical protein
MITIQNRIRRERAGLLEQKLTKDQIEAFIKHLHDEYEEELAKWDLKENLNQDFFDLINEETTASSSDTKGKLHELLVGYHLNGGKHMEKHPDKSGDSPEEAHEKLKSTVHPDEYKKINNRAKSAADDIKKKVESNGHKIHQVHWTSQNNDIQRTTGIKSSQKEDPSDLVVTTHKKEKTEKHPKVLYHGISLKVTDSSSKHVPTSNLGIKSAGPKAQDIHDDHIRDILKKYPKLATHARNAKQRKEMLKSDPKMHEFIKSKNTETINKVSKHLHEHLSSIPKDQLVHHIRNVIHAHTTPMQREGHNHIRHTSYTSGGATNPTFQHHSIDPSQHHEHIFNDAHNIEVHHSGGSIHFKYKGKTFARHSIKFSSQSDPLSSIKGSGQTSGD